MGKNKSKNKNKKKNVSNIVTKNNDNIQSNYPIGIDSSYCKLAYYSLIVPIVIAIVFFAVELYGIKRFPMENGKDILLMAISYLAPTIISTSCFMIFQQFFLYVPAGFDKTKGVVLAIAAFIVSIFYSVYLSGPKEMFEKIMILILVVAFFVANLFSIKGGKRKLDVGSFSG